MTYTVVIRQDGDTGRLVCDTKEEAQSCYQSFINYGKYQDVRIEVDAVSHPDDKIKIIYTY